jgi:hypothetical protein
MVTAFKRHDVVMHKKSGTVFVILADPQNQVRMGADGASGYLYQEFWGTDGANIWALDAERMEDGRFVLHSATTRAAEGRLPDS